MLVVRRYATRGRTAAAETVRLLGDVCPRALWRRRNMKYEPLTNRRPIKAGIHTLRPSPTEKCEYSAPTRSKNSPAKAHSLSLGTPGSRTTTTPRALAVPKIGNRKRGYPRCAKTD